MRAESGNHEAVNMDPGVQNQEENSRCLAELNNVLRHKGLLLPESGDLDHGEIRELLNEKIDSRQWKDALQQLLKKGSYFRTDGHFREKENQKDLKTFLERLLSACVEDDLEEHLKTMIDWLKELSENASHLDTILKSPQYEKEEEKEDEEEKEEKLFYKNYVAMKRACKKRDMATVIVLFQAGFRLQTRLEVEDSLLLTDDQLMAEISILKARASPVYLLAETKQNFKDPITKAMELIKVCETLAETRRGAIKKVGNVHRDLEKFLVKMLDLCRPSPIPEDCEVELFLSRG